MKKQREELSKMNLEEKNTNIKFSILAIVCIIIFSFALAPVSLQNDTFYTIKIGEHIVDTKTISKL